VRFVLASASQGRWDALNRAGIRMERLASGVDEEAVTASSARELVQTLADLKAHAVADRLVGEALVLGCDSLLEFEGQTYGKPPSWEATIERWQRMRGRSGTLLTGHCLIDRGSGRTATATVASTVRFADITDAEVELYVSTGEPSNVAGGFTIDGWGAWFIDGVDGDPSNVIGVSLPALRRMITELGYGLRDLDYPFY
jgi:septum formation protein